jgi:hypothetical protein
VIAPAEVSSGTRRIDDVMTGPRVVDSPPPPPRRSSLGTIALGLMVVGLGAFAVVQLRSVIAPSPTQGGSGTPASATVGGASGTVPSASTSAPATASTTEALPSVSAPATTSAVPTASTATATTGKLVITSSPPSRCELDGKPLGRTTIVTTAPIGDHRLVMHPDGLGESFERKITITAASGMDVHGDFNDEPVITLRRIPQK